MPMARMAMATMAGFTIPSGVAALDRLLGYYKGTGDQAEYTGVGGFPRGRYTVVWGPEAVGKSSLMARFMGKAQAAGDLVLLIDAENRADAAWMRKQGVNTENLLVHRGGIMEDGLQDLINLMEMVDFVVIDTVHALAPQAELYDGKKQARKMQDNAPMGRQAFALSKFFRVATSRVAASNTGIVLVGQARDSTVAQTVIKDLVGGNALRHYATFRIKITKIMDRQKVPRKKIAAPDGTVNEVPVGFLQKITLEKTAVNHLEGQSIYVPFLYGLGPDDFESNVMAAVAAGMVTKSGAWYEIPVSEGDPVRLQGRSNLVDFFREHRAHYEWIMNRLTSPVEGSED